MLFYTWNPCITSCQIAIDWDLELWVSYISVELNSKILGERRNNHWGVQRLDTNSLLASTWDIEKSTLDLEQGDMGSSPRPDIKLLHEHEKSSDSLALHAHICKLETIPIFYFLQCSCENQVDWSENCKALCKYEFFPNKLKKINSLGFGEQFLGWQQNFRESTRSSQIGWVPLQFSPLLTSSIN